METVKEKLIDEIEGLNWYHVNQKGVLVHGASSEDEAYWKCADVMAVIERVMQDVPNTDADKWVSVDERLPEKSEYLGIGSDGWEFYIRLEIAYKTDTIEYDIGYYDGFKWFNERNRIVKNVVGWRILKNFPQPPKEVQ